MQNRYDTLDRKNQLIWNLRDIGRTMRHISEGRGSQKRILIMLLEIGPITQNVLTEHLGIQPGSASEVLGKLEAAGLIERKPSATDRRTTDVALTEQGREQAEEASMQRIQRHEQMFSCLSDGEQAQLLALLEKLNADWDHRYRADGQEPRGGHGYGRHHGHR